jgi:organic radical activating enzyme
MLPPLLAVVPLEYWLARVGNDSPFCRRRCHYCSFVSYQGRESDIPDYVNAIEKELALRTEGQKVHSIYFGGGTPSLLSSEQIQHILNTIHSLFAVAKEEQGRYLKPSMEDVRKGKYPISRPSSGTRRESRRVWRSNCSISLLPRKGRRSSPSLT